jgi:glucose-6-phosphate-specific signal transduction histidine kinase
MTAASVLSFDLHVIVEGYTSMAATNASFTTIVALLPAVCDSRTVQCALMCRTWTPLPASHDTDDISQRQWCGLVFQ